MKRILKTGIIGCGKVTGMHAASLKAIAKSDFTAIYSRDEKKAVEYASRYGVKPYTSILEPPVNDLWTVPKEEHLLKAWVKEDFDYFNSVDSANYFHQLQFEDFINALLEGRKPMVSGEEGRVTVEIFTAIYRSQRDGKPVRFPLLPEFDRNEFDGRF